ncbi:MAG TPA: S41 family peptidase [Candidatus Paceibacterota bacterium]|nr:S41 family peptidase [Candidatus Paceibacterota bacterium]
MEKLPLHIKIGLRVLGGLVVAVGIFLGGVYVGYSNRPASQKITNIVHKEPDPTLSSTAPTDFEPFWKAWQIVDEKFPQSEKTSSDDRLYGAIKGMLASFGDPYTTFFSPSENKQFQAQISGEFYGIGAEIGEKDGVLTIIAPLKNTPADKAGLQPGDEIVKINDKTTTDMSVDEAVDLIHGPSGSTVALTIFRAGFSAPKVFSVPRAKITLPTVDTEDRTNDHVFIIHLYNFSAQATALFDDAFQKYLDSGEPNLLLDLRGNPGGYLDAAVQIGGLFLPQGKTIVKEIGKTDKDVNVYTSPGPDLFPKGNKLIILVDRGSASASEILSGALSEQGVGVLAGEKTFGKGSVQEVFNVTPDTSMKVTIAKWYTPNGISISETGLTPKIPLKEGTTPQKDTELDAAVALFKTL